MHMKSVFTFSLLIASATICMARESAYQALRAVGKERGEEVLNHVISVHGSNGAPQPAMWKITLEDSSARTGVRELEVKDGKIVSERTPMSASAGSVMNFQKLNLDSEGAFKIAVKEASKARVGFDSVDFTLHGGEEGHPPVWVMELQDSSHHSLGMMQIAADTGAVVRSSLYGSNRPHQPVVEDVPDRAPVVHDVDVPPGSGDDEYVEDSNGNHLRIGHKINKALHEAGASLEQFFTGKRTLDQKYRDEDQ